MKKVVRSGFAGRRKVAVLLGAALIAVAVSATALTNILSTSSTGSSTPKSAVTIQKSGNAGSVPTQQASTAPQIWVFAYSHFDQVFGAPGVPQKLAGDTIYEVVTETQTPSTLMPVIPTLDFHSYADMQTALQGPIPSDIKAVLYDNERYANTPLIEQQNPVTYTNKAIALAHAHGLKIICDYIQPSRYPGGYTPNCDVIGLNTVQQSERTSTIYASKVQKIMTAIRLANPNVPVVSGLSSNPVGTPVTSAELTASIDATRGLVQGYWLNVPAPGVGCPLCNLPQPQIAIGALLAM